MSLAEELKRQGFKVVTPQEGGQTKFVRSNVDVAFFCGTLGGGKTFGSILSVAEAVLDPNFKAISLEKI